ncbi:Leucine-rich repeat and WD repeat-containing protein 1 [Trichoplax sp. H2]|nr:Leucine-rich repeat and WD repeat-containing protein 1 [Trichoplax sp. H2]|eukprot:RDD36480.1 Leucine-rich repeat and WD repeat-containing protein 1 [Trichoplax sp. H2]
MQRRSSRAKGQLKMNVLLGRCDSKSLQFSKRLDLSSMQLSQLDIDALSTMKNLKELDVSKNRLSQLHSCHPMETVQFLDCSSNYFDASSITGICKAFPNLTQIKLFKNRALKKADLYEIVARLHQLRKINDMDANVMREELNKVNQELLARIHQEFIEAFGSESDSLAANMNIEELKNDFAEILQKNVSIGSIDLRLFVQRRLIELAYSYIDEKCSINNFRNKKRSSKINKAENNASNLVFPKEVFLEHSSSYIFDKCKLLKQHGIESDGCKLSPKYLLRMHSFNNDPEDKLTEIWQASFEPAITGSMGSVCAVCGGEIVAFVDCKTGKLMKRYKHPREIFYCLAWSSITLSSEKDKKSSVINILAAAGQCGEIRLIYPSQKICYAHISAQNRTKTPICSLVFHPLSPKLLFSGSEDGHVRVWEVDIPVGEYSAAKITYVHGVMADSRPRILRISSCGNWLLAAYDKYCIMWNIADIVARKKKPIISKITYKFPYTHGVPYFDGLVLLKNNLAVSKRKGDGFISLWDPFHDIDKLNFEAKVVREFEADVIAHLEYPKSSEWFMQLASHDDTGLISVGDNQSQIFLFDIKHGLSQINDLIFHVPVIKPFKILEFPIKRMKINQVIISPDSKFIVAVTSSNSVCVWETS